MGRRAFIDSAAPVFHYQPNRCRIMKDNKYFCYTVSKCGERDFQRIDKLYALQLNAMGKWVYSLPFKIVNSHAKALRWKHHLRD